VSVEATPWRDMPAYLQIVRSRVRTAVVYRYNTFFLLLLMVMQIFILRKVWTALYGDRASADGLTLHALLVYLTIANVQTWVFQDPTVTHYMYGRIREGQVAFDLVRPAGFVPQMFAHIVGSTAATGALPLVAVAGVLAPPASGQSLLLYVVSLVLGYLLTALLTLIVGMVAFWTMEISGLTMLYILVNQFFAGALVPVSMFPAPLRILADLLPFQATTYGPVAIYVGRLDGTGALTAIGVQLLWVVVLGAGARLMWRRALRRVVVQGG
jgi:viologen exporter family transport system permease protein